MERTHKRYLVRGFIDGLLSTLGVVIGASTAIGADNGVEASHIIMAAGVGGGVANGLSNILGAYMGEKLEMGAKFEEVERAMLKEEALRGTKVVERVQNRVISFGIFDGLATIGGAMVPVLPFIFIPLFTIADLTALYVSIVISLSLFFFLGAYVGRVAKENIVLSGMKMVAFGGVTAIVVTIIRLAF